MVNKAVVAVIGVILVTTLGVGALVGLQGGGGSPAEENPGSNNGGPGEGTPANGTNGTNSTNGTNGTNATVTPDGTATATETPAPDRLRLTRDEFTSVEIEENISVAINDWRRDEGLDPFLTGSETTTENLRVMAREFSETMADADTVAHTIGNDTTKRRYQAHGMFDTCKFKPPDSGYIARPGGPNPQQFEWIGRTSVDATFTQDQGLVFHENESVVADRIISEWRNDSAASNGLVSANYNRAGVGVTVDRDGTVYAAVHLCGE